MTGTASLATIGWLARSGGPTDRIRILLTAFGAALATLAMLSAFTVIAIGPDDGPYRPQVLAQQGLHVGVVTALLLLCIPVLGFTGQCTRIGAPARDRRLAALRLSGATPAEATKVACAESGLAAGVGSLLGLAGFLVVRAVFNDPVAGQFTRTLVDEAGFEVGTETYAGTGLVLPTDVLPPYWQIVVIVAAVPFAAAVFSGLALRQVAIGPLGVSRRRVRRPPRLLPAGLFLTGVVGLALFASLLGLLGSAASDAGVFIPVFLGLFLLVLVGLLMGSAALASLAGRLVARRTGSPALLIAARRLVADPFAASRAFGVLLIAVLFGAGALGFRSYLLTATSADDPFYRQTMDLVLVVVLVAIVLACLGLLVAAAEGVLSRRRTLAALTAAGTPTRTLGVAVLAEAVIPLLLAVPLAAVAGVLAVRGVYGTSASRSTQNGEVLRAIPVPWAGTALLVVGTLAVAALAVSISLAFLRASTDIVELRTG